MGLLVTRQRSVGGSVFRMTYGEWEEVDFDNGSRCVSVVAIVVPRRLGMVDQAEILPTELACSSKGHPPPVADRPDVPRLGVAEDQGEQIIGLFMVRRRGRCLVKTPRAKLEQGFVDGCSLENNCKIVAERARPQLLLRKR